MTASSLLTPVENLPHIVIEEYTTVGTGWRGRTQLAGITEVEQEEVATKTTYGDNIAAYAEPALPQIHYHVLYIVSGQVQESDFHDQIREEMLQSESTQPDASGDCLWLVMGTIMLDHKVLV
ncbi:hypothetical protein B9Z19DRAFT_1126134 [Tuber borchii]|uniref:Uncharacterized protein n=1 Tax=Tuber borchii TaxID=42251 RepID=A0A2T6ZTE7_TUBBO|nr:hypothetical protein B9Z19DRAFT_1126134 [Tuber borchii]